MINKITPFLPMKRVKPCSDSHLQLRKLSHDSILPTHEYLYVKGDKYFIKNCFSNPIWEINQPT